jgi:hypothetical protein
MKNEPIGNNIINIIILLMYCQLEKIYFIPYNENNITTKLSNLDKTKVLFLESEQDICLFTEKYGFINDDDKLKIKWVEVANNFYGIGIGSDIKMTSIVFFGRLHKSWIQKIGTGKFVSFSAEKQEIMTFKKEPKRDLIEFDDDVTNSSFNIKHNHRDYQIELSKKNNTHILTITSEDDNGDPLYTSFIADGKSTIGVKSEGQIKITEKLLYEMFDAFHMMTNLKFNNMGEHSLKMELTLNRDGCNKKNTIEIFMIDKTKHLMSKAFNYISDR